MQPNRSCPFPIQCVTLTRQRARLARHPPPLQRRPRGGRGRAAARALGDHGGQGVHAPAGPGHGVAGGEDGVCARAAVGAQGEPVRAGAVEAAVGVHAVAGPGISGRV